MKKIYQSLFLLLALGAVFSCTNIDELSDDNRVSGLDILSYSPQTIELGEIEMQQDTFYIPIVYGKYEFPLRFYARLKIDVDIDKVIGIDFSEEQCLESLDDVIRFYVMARSGLTRTYYIKAKEMPLDEDNYLQRTFSVLGATPGVRVSGRGTYSTRGDTLKIYSVGGSFPIEVTPEFGIGAEATFRNFDNGQTSLAFTGPESVHKIKVSSKSGAERIWNIRMVNLPVVSGSDGTSTEAQREGTDIEPREFSASLPEADGFEIYESLVDNASERIILTLKEQESKSRAAAVAFPLKVRIAFTSFEGVQLLTADPEREYAFRDFANDTTLVFESYDDTREFYMLDTESQVARHWKISLEEWIEGNADVLSFSYDYDAASVKVSRRWQTWPPKYIYTYAPSIELDRSNVEIYPRSAEIFINATAIATEFASAGICDKDWKLTLKNIDIALSKGASCTLPEFTWVSNYEGGIFGVGEKANDCWKEEKTFTVTAEDGTEKTWSLKIREPNSFTPSSGCELLAFGIERVMPNYAKIDELGTKIDPDTHTVTIKLIEDDRCYPLSIFPAYTYSDYASISTQNGGTEPLVFETDQSTQTVTILAQDKTTSATWTVKLQAPPKEAQADVTDFKVTSVSQGSEIESVSRDDDKAVIRLNLGSKPAFPMETGYSMTLSAKAASDLPLRGTLSFASYTDVKEFVVTAQNGTTKTWKIKPVYEPQLENWTLDKWGKDSQYGLDIPLSDGVWATANNTFTSMTTPTTGVSGQAAHLESKNAPIIKTFAAGSVFTGWFDTGNAASLGLKDPVKLTYFGIPWETSGKMLGVEADLSYHPGGGAGSDNGSVQLYLIRYDGSAKVEFHGNKPGTTTPHEDNNAVAVASGYALIGTQAGTGSNGTAITVVPDGTWTRVFIPFDYPGGTVPAYTHLSVCFSSSYEGDSFKGTVGSTLKVDNVKIIYAEEE